MATAAQRGGDRRGIELGQARANHAEDPTLHLHQADERERVGEVDELVRQIRHPVDVGGPGDRSDQHLDPRDRVRLEPGTVYTLLEQDGDVVVDLGSGNRLILAGVALADLPPGWIFGG